MAHFTPDPAIRALQDQLTAEHPDLYCYSDMCRHDTPPPRMPSGVIAAVGMDTTSAPRREVVVLVRFTRRRLGGWDVVRADNRRLLGWTVNASRWASQSRWSAHVCSAAFRGDGPDNDGDLLDRVDHRLHNGKPDDSFQSASIDVCRSRQEAAESIVQRLVSLHAPAVGYPRHPDVRLYRTRPEQHFEMDAGRCVCGELVPCPERARLLAVTR